MDKTQILRRGIITGIYGLFMMAAQFVAAGELGKGLGLPYLVGVALAVVILSPYNHKINGVVVQTFAIIPWPKVRAYGMYALLFGGLYFATINHNLFSAAFILMMLAVNVVFRFKVKTWKVEFDEFRQRELERQNQPPASQP